MWVNEWTIDDFQHLFRNDPILQPAAQFLSDFRDLINANSDGWAYWSYGTKCSKELVVLVQQAAWAKQGIRHLLPEGYQKPTRTDVEAATVPILNFMKKEPQMKGWTPPKLQDAVQLVLI